MVNGSIILGFIAIFLIGCVSLIGLTLISVNQIKLHRVLAYLVAFATGMILGTIFLDLLPEGLHEFELIIDGSGLTIEWMPFLIVLGGFFIFYLIEHFLHAVHLHHIHDDSEKFTECLGANCTDPHCKDDHHPRLANDIAVLNLIGDGLHNFLDGVIIMVSFMGSIGNGLIVTMAVFLHELPQEIGDFGILLAGGMKNKRALFWNFISAMTALLGGLIAFLLSGSMASFNAIFMLFSAGGFLYIATVKLMPSLMDEKKTKQSIGQALICTFGLLLTILLLLVLPHGH